MDVNPCPVWSEFLRFLRQHGIRFVWPPTTPRRCRKNWPTAAGWGAVVRPEEIVTSSIATADYLGTTLPAGARLYVVGMEGLRVPLVQQRL